MHDRPLDCLIDPADAADAPVRTVRCVRPNDLAAWSDGLPAADRAWLRAQGFVAKAGELLRFPGPDGIASAVLGLGEAPGLGWCGVGALARRRAALAVRPAPAQPRPGAAARRGGGRGGR